MHTAYLLFGGNIGDVPSTFSAAMSMLEESGICIVSVSSLYNTEPWGMSESTSCFYNMAVAAKTHLAPKALMDLLLRVEQVLGRKREQGVAGSRTIDIDILFYNQETYSLSGLIIPHPRTHLRKFALLPLSEIAPELIHPQFGKSIQQLLKETKDTLGVNKTDRRIQPFMS